MEFVLLKRFALALVAALITTGCSGGGGSTPSSPNVPASRAAAAVSISLGAQKTAGSNLVFPVTVDVTDAAGQTVTGSYTNPVMLSTSDTTNTGFSASANGTGETSTFSVTSSTEPVYFVFDQATLAAPVTVSVSVATAIGSQFVFTPPTGTTSSNSATPIASLSLAANGALPQTGSAGSFTLTVAAYGSVGTLITGTYSTPIVLTTNDSTDLMLSVAGGTPSSSVSVTSPSQIVVVSYDGQPVPAGTQISASTAGVASVSTPFAPSASGTVTGPTGISSLSLSQVGALPNQGTAGQFGLVVTADTAAGQPISGTYPTNVVVSSNDSTDLTFSTSASGPFTASVVVPSSSTVVYVSYTGAQVPTSTKFSASAGNVTGTLTFNPAAQAVSTPYIAKLNIMTAGAAPQGCVGNSCPEYGAQPIYIQAFDQNGNTFNGTYPTQIRITLNNSSDLQLSIGSYAPAVICQAYATNPPLNPCPNIAAIVVNGSGQAIFADYADGGPGLSAVQGNPNPDISITTDGIECAAIQFPLANMGSTPYACQALNPGSIVRKNATTATSWQFVRKATKI